MVWLCCEGSRRIMLIFVLFLTLWNLSNSAVIETGHLSKRSYDTEWWKDFTLPTLPTFDWGRFTLKPEDRDNKPTPTPFNFNRFTIDWNKFSIDWKRLSINPFDPDIFTRKPFEWNRPTSKPYEPNEWNIINNRDDYRYNNKDNNTALKLIIVLPVLGLVFIVWFLRYSFCKNENNSTSSMPTVHPPPERVIIAPPANVHVSPQNDPWTSQNSRQELSFTVPIVVPNENFRVASSSNRSNAADKPPQYNDVVLSDMSGQQNCFPEVNPTISEQPPPQYDDKEMRY